MQPKFTYRSLVYFFSRLSMFSLVMALTTLISFAQKPGQKNSPSLNPDRQARFAEKIQLAKGGASNVLVPRGANNDRGISNATANQSRVATTSRTEAICATFTGNFTGAPTMTNRLFRPGATTSCTLPYTFPGTFAQTVPYRTFTYTNTTGLTQCGTFTLTTVGAASNAQFAMYANSFNPASLATNYLADPGVSGVGAPVSFQGTIASGATIVFAVFDLGTPATSFTLNVDFPICASAPCAATPNPGNTNATVTGGTVCSGINFTLSLQNATSGSGVTYQWQSAPSSTGPWTNISGATGATYTTSQTAATCYQAIVSCAGNGSGTSTPVCIALTPASNCYCTPPPSDCTDDDVITRVRISSLDNASACGTGPPLGYTNYTTTVAAPIVFAGAPNPITVNKPTVWTEGVAVWIDYNQNGNFEASELTSLGTQPAAVPALTGNINIPASALLGVTRMRVRMQFAAVPAGPCNAFTFGETEDYSVNIQPCVPVTFTGQPSNASVVCGGNTSFSVTTTGSLPAYRWEFRPNASAAWQFVPSAPPYSGENTATLTLTNVSAALNGFQYRATVVGACSATDVSSAATLTVTPIVPVVNPASATICLGSIQQLSLTNSLSAPTTVTFNASTGLPLAIPDNTPNGVSNTIAVSGIPAGAVITNVGVRFNMTHTWVGDMVFNLRAPNTQTLNLVGLLDGGTGGNATANFVNTAVDSVSTIPMSGAPAPRTGTYRADKFTATVPTGFGTTTNSWSALTGTMNGNWTLGMCDLGPGDFGNLTSWSIYITYVSPTLAQGTWTGPAGTMFTNAAATTAYTGTPATTIYVQPTVVGVNNYQVSFTTPTPCTSSTTTVPVTVVAPAAITTNPVNRTVCVGGSTSFSVVATGGPVTYQWQVSTDGGLTYTNITGATSATYNLTGITSAMTGYRYRVIVTAAPCAGSVTSTVSILTVNALPTVTLSSPDLQLTPGQLTSITASSTPAAATGGYVWTLNGTTIAGNNTNTVSGIGIDQIGTYTATVTDINGCSATSASLTIGTEASDNLWIYPNPTTGQFQVRVYYDPSAYAEKRVVYIYNSDGQLMTSREFNLLGSSSPYMRMDFDLGRAAKGTYVVKVVHKYTGKIISGLVVVQ